jgi:Spy/CpxP family protein refolding chaperone
MKSKIKFAVLLSVLVLAAGSAYAWGPGPRGGCPGEGPRFQTLDRLNLSPEQKAQIKELRDKFWKDTVSLRNEMQVKRLELKTLWTAAKPEKDKIVAKQKELNDLKLKMQEKSTDFRLQIRSHLTAEQAAQVGNLASWRGKVRGHPGFRRCGMGGF